MLSHVDVPGNEEADQLSNVSHYPTKATPVLQIICTSATPKAKKAKAKIHEASFHTLVMPRTLDFFFWLFCHLLVYVDSLKCTKLSLQSGFLQMHFHRLDEFLPSADH